MNTWHLRYLRVTLRTPLHIGDRPLGFVSRALPFVPSHIPVMALVPTAVQKLGFPDERSQYVRMQKFLEQHLRFTPLFIRNEATGQPMIPTDNQMEQIELHIVNARYGIAVNYGERSAREGGLYEIEAVSPLSRYGAPTIMEGYLFWKAGQDGDLSLNSQGELNQHPLHDLLALSQWGGERSKGYGSLASVELNDMGGKKTIWQDAAVATDTDEPIVEWPCGQAAPFYLRYDPAFTHEIKGRIIPLSGRLYDPERGSGQAAPAGNIVWDMGWKSSMLKRLRLGVKVTSSLFLA